MRHGNNTNMKAKGKWVVLIREASGIEIRRQPWEVFEVTKDDIECHQANGNYAETLKGAHTPVYHTRKAAQLVCEELEALYHIYECKPAKVSITL